MTTDPTIQVLTPDEAMKVIDDAFSGKKYDTVDFSRSAMGLFKEYYDAYTPEWQRMDNCDRLYIADTWPLIKANASVNGTPTSEQADGCDTSKMPEPSIPIIHSTIENLEADLDQELPECYIEPQDGLTEFDARLLNLVMHRQFEDSDFDEQYYASTHELLTYGWDAFEIGYEMKGTVDTKDTAPGYVFIRHVPSRTILFDPTTSSVQDARAIFKFDRHPAHWFRQHYPDKFADMKPDIDRLNDEPMDPTAPQKNTVAGRNEMLMVEMWYRQYDAKENRYRVHMAQFAGGVEVLNSAKVKPEGMYDHGRYPFELECLYERTGTPFGYGIADIHASLQMYSDKLNQIIMTSALRSSRGRVFISAANEESYDDIIDFSNEAVKVNDINGVQWWQDKPLPQYIMNYVLYLQQSIKEESGTNDQSRGVSKGGVTAASAIDALQVMATKRSTKIAERRQKMFARLGAMVIDTLADCSLTPFFAVITKDGQPSVRKIDSKLFKTLQRDGQTLASRVFVRVSRKTRYSQKEHNELALQFMQLAAGQNTDFTPFIELMDFDGKELVLDKIRASRRTEMAILTQQVQEMSQEIQMLQDQLKDYKTTMQRAQAAMTTRNQQLSEERAAAPLEVPKGMADVAV